MENKKYVKEGIIMKRMLLFVGVLCLVLGFTTVAYAEDNEKARSLILAQDFNKIPREALLGIYAYGVTATS